MEVAEADYFRTETCGFKWLPPHEDPEALPWICTRSPGHEPPHVAEGISTILAIHEPS